MLWIIYLFVLIGAVYTVIPDLLLHRLGIGAMKHQYTPGVVITFDDGPNPEITPQILEILEKNRVSATFFLIGEKAARYPNLVKLILDRGHQIGAHSQHHKYAWFLSPWRTWSQWDSCIAVLEDITGKKVEWVRPPWGTFNIVLWFWLIVRKKKAVLWDVEGHDWQEKMEPEQIVLRVTRQVKEGSIVVLHDDGGDNMAPNHTLKALETICRNILEEQKLPLVKLEFSSWSWWRRGTYTLWNKWERLFARMHNVERISSTSILRVSKYCYKGPSLYTDSGILLAASGDIVGEIHFDSARLPKNAQNAHKLIFETILMLKQSLPELADFVNVNPDYQEIKVFAGLSLLNRGVGRLGFSVQEVPETLFNRWVGLLQKLIVSVYHPAGKSRFGKPMGGNPKLVWISRQQLLKKWLR